MNRILSTFILLTCFANAPLAMATTILYGAEFNVSSDPQLSGGYNTHIFLNEGESFNIYLGDFEYALSGSLVTYDPDMFSIFGRIEGQNLGNFFRISLAQDSYLADNTGYLYLYNQYTGANRPLETSFTTTLTGRVPNPSTLMLMTAGLLGVVVVNRKSADFQGESV